LAYQKHLPHKLVSHNHLRATEYYVTVYFLLNIAKRIRMMQKAITVYVSHMHGSYVDILTTHAMYELLSSLAMSGKLKSRSACSEYLQVLEEERNIWSVWINRTNT